MHGVGDRRDHVGLQDVVEEGVGRFRMRRVLSDEQHAKMKEMHDHDRRERDKKPKGDLHKDEPVPNY